MSRDKKRIILVQPTMGISGEFAWHIPLSLLYVAAGLRKHGYEIILLDNRFYPANWREKLRGCINENVLFVGLTVMTGAPIANAIAVSEYVKELGDIPVVWGGAHPTVRPQQTLQESYVDFTVSGSGVSAGVKLAERLKEYGNPPEKNWNDIPGLGYKNDGQVCLNSHLNTFEHVSFQEMPYDLVEDVDRYGQIGSEGERIFPIYSVYGCPYQCTFCIAPAMYRDVKNKWQKLPTEETVDHMEYLKKNYGATQIYFYDDDSFVRLDHIRGIMDEVRRRDLKLKLSFRGARINEVLKMDRAYLDDLAEAGTKMLHIGLESGSKRILDLYRKGTTADHIREANHRVAQSKRIIAAYNWIVGTPTETVEDIWETRNLILDVVRENPRCFVFPPNKFRPLPNTPLAELAKQYGYQEPQKLEDWIQEELEGDKKEPWYTPEVERVIRMLQVTSYFVDHKAEVLLKSRSLRNVSIKLMYGMYKPLAKLRFRYGITKGLVEYPVYQFFVSRYRK